MDDAMLRSGSTSTFESAITSPSVSSASHAAPPATPPRMQHSTSTPMMSPPLSIWSPNGLRRRNGRIHRSTRIDPEAYKGRTPWHETPIGKSTLRRTRWTCLGVTTIGFLAAAAVIVTGYLAVPKHEYCLVLDEQFNGNSIDTSIWQHEVQLGGFGNHEFEMTTTNANNSFIEDGMLYIVPTLSNYTYGNDNIMDNFVLNFTADGTCTSTVASDCVAFSNSTAGNYSIIPPIQSARLTTKLSKSIKYGKIEVKAKMPTGEWIWPAIWMMPTESKYGAWPASGEIDIVETKGNAVKHEWDTNANTVQSTLHWGLDTKTDQSGRTHGWRKLKRKYANQAFNTYGLFWDTKSIRTWFNKPSRVLNEVKFNQPFWNRGKLADTMVNNTVPVNPWTTSENPSVAPFDEEFYLILSVAVGGTNGWFEDGADKPWANASPTAARDFWLGKERWLSSWPTDPKERGMAIDYVKIWRLKEKGETCSA
ncbi:hypothetical protein JCM8097_006484 [Rhodosporidiobolus ruineniae]